MVVEPKLWADLQIEKGSIDRMAATLGVNIDAGKSPEQLCAARIQRALDAAQLRQPDQIPISLGFGNSLADLEGITRQELAWEPEKVFQALSHAALRFQPDFAGSSQFSSPTADKILGNRLRKWPGYGLSADQSFQFIEGEYMKAEDYDAFIADPGDWTFRTYLPRICSELEGFAMLSHLALLKDGPGSIINKLTIPQVASAFQALNQAAQAQAAYTQQAMQIAERMAALGFPSMPFASGGFAAAPFDYLCGSMRGMRGIFLDLRRCPEKLLAAEEKVIDIQLNDCITTCRGMNRPGVFLPLHRGSDGFISIPDFEKFYWQQLKKLLLGLIDAGITPTIFWEGCWDQRLKYLAELPKGKTIGMFQSSDIFKVKQVLGDTMCIVGGMKVSMLGGGATAEEVRAYTKRLCQEVGKGGGFIMSTDVGEMESCKPEMIKVWVDATREFGRY
jgi:uroporphyrinogen-III decarboxylase